MCLTINILVEQPPSALVSQLDDFCILYVFILAILYSFIFCPRLRPATLLLLHLRIPRLCVLFVLQSLRTDAWDEHLYGALIGSINEVPRDRAGAWTQELWEAIAELIFGTLPQE